MKCTNCGTQNTDDARHCRRCGAVLPTSSEVTQPTQVAANDAGGIRPLDSDQRISSSGTRPLVDNTIPPANLTAELPGNAAATRPLPRNRLFFEALPERAVLSDGHYRVRYLIEESPLLNTYSTVSRQALIECRSCGFAHNHYGDQFCKQCGASLSELEPHYPNFILKESAAADAIATERRLAEMNLHHGGALLPAETFSEVIFGTRRFYVVLPEPSPFSGINLPEQPETTDIVSWGLQLADALAYLHKNNVTISTATLEHISISGKAARWFNFAEARLQPANTRNRKPYTDDIVSLTTNLFVLLTGKTYSPSVEVSPPGL
ncbi:MAG TPA: zinc ribbon domain-containing protein, partial [Anaerolineae bacterium]